MPKPTVTVRMEESGISRSDGCVLHRASDSPCALILVLRYKESTMNQRLEPNVHRTTATPEGPSGRIAFIQACWHKEIVDQCRDAFIVEMAKLGFAKSVIDLFEVPGSLEIPLQAQILAKSGRYNAIVASGLIVDGGIYRHEFVADTVIGAMMRVQLDTEVPIISAVLTPRHFHEHDEHRKFFHAHFVVKGAEAARACAATIENMNRLKKLCA
jgi:6,7-dimethyl-8-ribityllumazine synthase